MMRLAVISALLILEASFACLAQGAAQLHVDALLTAAQKSMNESGSLSLRVLEAKALSATDADAERHADVLLIHLKSRGTMRFKDGAECENPNLEAQCQEYALVVHARSRHVFVVARLYYESIEFLLVDDDTGDQSIVSDLPVFSPTGDQIVVLLDDPENLGSAVQIWRRAGHKFILNWKGTPFDEGMYTSYKLLRWPSEGILELEAKILFEPPRAAVERRFELRQTAKGWKVVGTP